MKNNQGSVMVLTILVMMVVTILGAIVVNMTMVSYKMKITNTTAEQNLYLSESGLDEVFAAVKLTTDEGIKSGNHKVEEFYNTFDIEVEKSKEDSLFIDDDGNIDELYMRDHVNKIFTDEYKNYVKVNIFDNLDSSNLVLTDNCSITLDPINSGGFNFDTNGDEELKVISETRNKGVKRATRATICISTPDFFNPIREDRVVEMVNYIPLFDQAIAADKDVYLKGKVYIKGNVFAYSDLYGILVGGEGSDIDIEGDIYTNGQITLNDSDIRLKAYDIYLNNIDISDSSSYLTAESIISKEEIVDLENITYTSLINDISMAEKYINTMGDIDFITDEVLKISNQYDATNNGTTENDEYIFATTNSNDKNIYLLGKGAEDFTGYESRDLVLNLSDKESYKGIIVSKGNTYIMGSLNFEGIIISYESIYFDDIGYKVIKNSKRVIYEMIDDDKIKTEFNMDNAQPKGSIVSIDYSLTSPSGITSERLVEMKNWSIIK
jgi:hypothetical protein